jgi:hypothetical protein
MRRLLVLAVAGFVLLGATSAVASHKDVFDPDDVHGLLDLRKVSVYGGPPVWNIRTYNSWRASTIWDKGYVLVYLDTFGDERYDYYALVRSNGSSMTGQLMRDRKKKRDYRVAYLYPWRTSKKNVKVRIRLAKMNFGDNRNFYRWHTQTIYTGSKCKQTCLDFAPLPEAGITEPLK